MEDVAEQERAPGAFSYNGKLFFRLLDGTTVLCECIKNEYVEMVVEACNAHDAPSP